MLIGSGRCGLIGPKRGSKSTFLDRFVAYILIRQVYK